MSSRPNAGTLTSRPAQLMTLCESREVGIPVLNLEPGIYLIEILCWYRFLAIFGDYEQRELIL